MTYPEKNYIVSGLTDGCEDDYDEDPIAEDWRYTFRDGSEIVLRDFEEPIVSGKRKCLAREVADWIELNEADMDQSIHYILTNYK